MKKFAFALALALPMMFASCGDDDVTEVNLSTYESTINYKATTTLTADQKGGVWTSNDTFVATVEDGVVTGKHVGTAVITYTVGDASASCKVTVNPTLATWYLPCMNWGMTMDAVKSYMGNTTLTLNENPYTGFDKDNNLFFENAEDAVNQLPWYVYTFKNGGLDASSVTMSSEDDVLDGFEAFMKQYYNFEAMTETTPDIYYNANTLNEATVKVEADFDDNDDYFTALFMNVAASTKSGDDAKATMKSIVNGKINSLK